MKSGYGNVDSYIDNFEGEVKNRLIELRKFIRKEVPDSVEVIKYGIPTYTLKRNLIHFGGYKQFISIYPGPKVIETLKNKLEGYKTSKGAIQFDNSMPLPWDLIKKIVDLSVKINSGEPS